jgi:hypothetical protein
LLFIEAEFGVGFAALSLASGEGKHSEQYGEDRETRKAIAEVRAQDFNSIARNVRETFARGPLGQRSKVG